MACLTCTPTYFLNATTCSPCLIANCSSCSITTTNTSLTRCTLCLDTLIVSNNQCLTCAELIPNCSLCSGSVFPVNCTSCKTGLIANKNWTSCESCGSIIANCEVCSFQGAWE